MIRAISTPPRAAPDCVFQVGGRKGTGTFCRDGPSGASHKRSLSPFPPVLGQPVPLALERIGRQHHAAAWLAAVQTGPVDFHALGVELRQTRQQDLPGRLAAFQARQPEPGPLPHAPPAQAQQLRLRPDLQENPIALFVERGNSIGEADRLAKLARQQSGPAISSPAGLPEMLEITGTRGL